MPQIEAMRNYIHVPALQPNQRAPAPQTSTSPSTRSSQIVPATEAIPLPSPQAQQKSTGNFITNTTSDGHATGRGSDITVVVSSSEQPQLSVTVDRETFIGFLDFASQKAKKDGKK